MIPDCHRSLKHDRGFVSLQRNGGVIREKNETKEGREAAAAGV